MITLHQSVIVQQGGRIEIVDPSLAPGLTVEVTVTLDDTHASGEKDKRNRMADFTGMKTGAFRSGEEIDAYTREMRNEWD